MSRVIISAACLLALAGCTSWIPNLDFGGYTADLRAESDPPGAEARAGNKVCRTPCTLLVDARGDISVAFNLEGYLPQTVRVQVRVPGDPRFDPNAASNVQFDPNPVAVVLDPAPPPPKPKPVRRRPQPKRKPAAAAPPRPAAMAPAPAVTNAPQRAPVTSQPVEPRTLPSTMSPGFGPTISPVPSTTAR
jgi:hypothetical protein